jgi:hypothetical protein
MLSKRPSEFVRGGGDSRELRLRRMPRFTTGMLGAMPLGLRHRSGIILTTDPWKSPDRYLFGSTVDIRGRLYNAGCSEGQERTSFHLSGCLLHRGLGEAAMRRRQ